VNAVTTPGLGWVAPLISSLTTVTSMIFQERMAARQHKQERHERQRRLAEEQAARDRAAAAAKAAAEAQMVQAQLAAGATGGAVATNAQGQLLPASGIATAMPAGGRNMLMLGVAGVAVVGLFMFMGRR
jgi:regulator of protease activity HflC (stomatin/prohibitin superfamily)